VIDPTYYDKVVVPISGGKDSLACLLYVLFVLGVPRERVEVWHYDVDGREGSKLMDWPCTRDYCRKLAAALGVTIYFAWKVGGFEGEMLRDNAPTAPTRFETPDGLRETGGKSRKRSTRKKYPQIANDLNVRWCSAYLKIDVCAAAVRNQARFNGKRTLIVTGERAEESTARAKYEVFEVDRADRRRGRRRRHVDQLRPVHNWLERDVWEIIARYSVNPHPAYRLGWGRVSCAACIFGSPNQWASLRVVNPAQFSTHAGYERLFGRTIHRKLSVIQLADRGTPYEMREGDIRAALSETFDEAIILPEGAWRLPAGAFGESCGPT
jgi:3'-phosphoadenosine 5'-phosphosulfate sulfotransferase (PAPS reductase)/FAD synthetase